MKKNMGTSDRIIRTFIALIIAILYFTNILTGTVGIVFLVLAAIFVLTSLVGFCPIYAILAINSCPKKINR